MSACTEHFRTVQDIEQARDYSRHASRGVDSGRLFVHAPCTLQSALGGAHHAPAEPPAQVVRLGCEGEGRCVSPQARLRLLHDEQRARRRNDTPAERAGWWPCYGVRLAVQGVQPERSDVVQRLRPTPLPSERRAPWPCCSS